MGEVRHKEGEVDLCVLVLDKDFDERLLETLSTPKVAFFLAFNGRDLSPEKAALLRRLGRVYVCTYVPFDVPPWAEPSGPLKMLHICGGSPVLVV